jgi:hypothetical protein
MAKIIRPQRPLADVNVLPQGDGSHEVVVCFMPDPDLVFGGEGNSRAFLALDASNSIKEMYGFGGPFGGTPNYMQSVARKLGSLLASISRSGTVTAVYWAVSPDGGKVEPLGEIAESAWPQVAITGPQRERWGRGTKLLPALQYCVTNVAGNADWTIGVLITDGKIDDEPAAMDFCIRLAREIAAGRRKPIKLVLIGIGEEVDRDQLQRFDDMSEEHNINFDLWSHGLVASMQDEQDILGVLYGELMSEHKVVAARGQIEDVSGRVLRRFSDGLPGKFRFVLPRGQHEFVLRTPTQVIRQDVSSAMR